MLSSMVTSALPWTEMPISTAMRTVCVSMPAVQVTSRWPLTEAEKTSSPPLAPRVSSLWIASSSRALRVPVGVTIVSGRALAPERAASKLIVTRLVSTFVTVHVISRTNCSPGPAAAVAEVHLGSAFELVQPLTGRTCPPAYAAPEVLGGAESTPRSDLASLGYALVEMLSGSPPFAGLTSYRDLLEAKRFLAQRLPRILPEEVVCNELLMSFCRGLVAPDPMRRFPSAEAANLVEEGAAAFHRQLIRGDLASEYDNEIRLWLEELKELEEQE